MQFGLTEEQEMIVSTVRSFVENEIYPHEAEVERTGQVPHELGEEIKQKCIDLGFYACNFPEEVGGAGLSHLDFTLVERELGRGSMALTHFFGRPQNILMACNDEQRERYLLPAVRGEKMDALAMTEPDAGSDVRGMKCQAQRDGEDWVINGSKHFISGAEHADFFIVFIATGVDDTPKGPKKRITTFLVDRGTPGFDVREGYNSVSHKGYKNYILSFDDCRLPNAQVLGEVDGGFAVMNEWLYATRLTVAAFSVGRARRCFDYALNYASERKQFGQPIGKFQGVSFQIADMITEIDAADWLTLSAAWRLDNNLPSNREIASAKLYASEALARVTDTTLQIFGGMGLMDDFPIERFWRDARVERIWDGTSEIQRHIISRDLLRPLGACWKALCYLRGCGTTSEKIRGESHMKPVVTITYCVGCKWLLRAGWMAQELLQTFGETLGGVTIAPAEVPGTFKITVDGTILWDRKRDGSFPEAKELKQRLRDVIEPERDLGHSDR